MLEPLHGSLNRRGTKDPLQTPKFLVILSITKSISVNQRSVSPWRQQPCARLPGRRITSHTVASPHRFLFLTTNFTVRCKTSICLNSEDRNNTADTSFILTICWFPSNHNSGSTTFRYFSPPNTSHSQVFIPRVQRKRPLLSQLQSLGMTEHTEVFYCSYTTTTCQFQFLFKKKTAWCLVDPFIGCRSIYLFDLVFCMSRNSVIIQSQTIECKVPVSFSAKYHDNIANRDQSLTKYRDSTNHQIKPLSIKDVNTAATT